MKAGFGVAGVAALVRGGVDGVPAAWMPGQNKSQRKSIENIFIGRNEGVRTCCGLANNRLSFAFPPPSLVAAFSFHSGTGIHNRLSPRIPPPAAC